MSRTAHRAWIRRIFQAKAVAKGGVVRRSVEAVQDYGGGVKNLKREVKRRKFHLIRTGDQYVVLCHKGKLSVIC